LEAPCAPQFRTSLCDLLGIEHPIVQAGMGGVAGPQLAAAVSGAGGLGIVGSTFTSPDEVRKAIREVRALTDRPFGVNLLLHSDVSPPADVSRIPESAVRAVQSVLNRFRERLGLPASSAPPAPPWTTRGQSRRPALTRWSCRATRQAAIAQRG
jgi:NAD(P)H-dependent flavin oxidoreductase YrpB (nitropropane dioxygenase family)